MSSRCGDAYMIIVSQVSAAESALAALLRLGDGHGHRGANSVYGAAPVAGRTVAAVAALGGPAWPVMVIVAHSAAGQSSVIHQSARKPAAKGRRLASIPVTRAVSAVGLVPWKARWCVAAHRT